MGTKRQTFVADLLYCNNIAFNALSVIVKMPSDKRKGIDFANAAKNDYGYIEKTIANIREVAEKQEANIKAAAELMADAIADYAWGIDFWYNIRHG